jgi:hypothetical protein
MSKADTTTRLGVTELRWRFLASWHAAHRVDGRIARIASDEVAEILSRAVASLL